MGDARLSRENEEVLAQQATPDARLSRESIEALTGEAIPDVRLSRESIEVLGSEVCTFECSMDGAAFTPCTSPIPYAGLADGAHTFAVRAILAGSTDPSPATYGFVIGSINTVIDSTDIDLYTATFTFSATEPGSTFECSMDDATFTACTSPSEYDNLAVGPHTFSVRAIDSNGNVDPTPATSEFDIEPPAARPTRPSKKGRLGCSINNAYITWRCGSPRMCFLKGITSLSYTRVLDDISEAEVTVTLSGSDDLCCECLGDIEPWCHELHITRDNQETWVGPITEIVYGYETVTIRALDILGWLKVRISETNIPESQVSKDLTAIAEEILFTAYAEDDDDGECILDYRVAKPTGVIFEFEVLEEGEEYEPMFPAYTDTAFEQLEKLTDLGLDFTVIGRSIIIGPEIGSEKFPVQPIATLKDEHIMGNIELTKSGYLQGNRWFVHFDKDEEADPPGPGMAQGDMYCYSRIERISESDTALQTLENAQETAQSRVDYGSTAPRLIELPSGSQLSPETPWTLAEMIPGARVDVSLTKLCVNATQSFKLVGVEVSQDAAGEKVSVSLAPYNIVEGV